MIALAAAMLFAGAIDPAAIRCTLDAQAGAMFKPSSAAICARFAATLARELAARPHGSDAARPSMDVAITSPSQGVVEARAGLLRDGRATALPPVAIAISDRSPDLGDIDQLAREIAQRIRTAY